MTKTLKIKPVRSVFPRSLWPLQVAGLRRISERILRIPWLPTFQLRPLDAFDAEDFIRLG